MPKNFVDNNKNLKTSSDSSSTKKEREKSLIETTLDNIGTPADLHKVDVRPLHSVNHHRINVYRKINGQSKITDSFYVVQTDEGLMSSPPMEKKYYDDVTDL